MQKVNWGRMTVVFTILPALLNFMGMVWSLMDGNWESAFTMAAMVAVCVCCTVLIWRNTE